MKLKTKTQSEKISNTSASFFYPIFHNSNFSKHLYLLYIIYIFLISCHIFEPRKAEEPNQQVFEWHETASNVDYLLDNLIWSYKYAQNQDKYIDLFSDNYYFYFDNLDISDYNLPARWDKTSESNIIRNCYSYMKEDDQILITLSSNNDSDEITSFFAKIYRNYDIIFNHTKDNFPKTFHGRFEIEMEYINGEWKITSWKDFREDSPNTWGRLKNEFSS